jgi:predicted nucleic acid-binding protein
MAWLLPHGTPPVAEETPPQAEQPSFEALEADPGAAAEPVDATLTGTQLAGLVAFVGCAAAALVWIRRRMPAAPAGERPVDGDPSPIDSVVARVVDQLRLGNDPRSAVLLAYAELERGMANAGHPRRPSETPAEHIRRVMRLEPIDTSALVELAHLYERARFSEHPVTVQDQRAASVALERLRSALVVTS